MLALRLGVAVPVAVVVFRVRATKQRHAVIDLRRRRGRDRARHVTANDTATDGSGATAADAVHAVAWRHSHRAQARHGA